MLPWPVTSTFRAEANPWAITIEWDPVIGAIGYRVKFNNEVKIIPFNNILTYTFENAMPTGLYEYTICADTEESF